jgi:hypothetical protein
MCRGKQLRLEWCCWLWQCTEQVHLRGAKGKTCERLVLLAFHSALYWELHNVPASREDVKGRCSNSSRSSCSKLSYIQSKTCCSWPAEQLALYCLSVVLPGVAGHASSLCAARSRAMVLGLVSRFNKQVCRKFEWP